MKPGKAPKAIAGLSFMLALAVFVSGCSSRSQFDIFITSIVGGEGVNKDKEYLECDIIGSEENGCTAIQDTISVAVALEDPQVLGPTLAVYLTGYTLEYFYFDPADGGLKGPIPGLTLRGTNMRIIMPTSGEATFTAAPMTFRFKTWSVGVTCHDLIGFGGVDNVSRVIIRITVHAEDTTGKTSSASGSILAYLYDYAPAPLDPSSSTDVSKTWCYGMTPEAYWSALCP